jgi:predicted RNase H-like HicB family nuclease
MHNEFTAVFERDGEWYIAYCPEIPGANGQGRTKEEARQSLAEAIALVLEDRRQEGLRRFRWPAGQSGSRRHPHGPLQLSHDCRNFLATQHDRQPLRRPRVNDEIDRTEIDAQYFSIEKQEGAERLVLRRCTHSLSSRQPGEKLPDFRGAHLRGMTFVVKEHGFITAWCPASGPLALSVGTGWGPA